VTTRLFLIDVDGGCRHDPVVVGLDQGVLVHDPAAGGVNDPDPGLHLGELLLAEHPLGLGGLRQVDGDEVGAGAQLVERGQRRLHLGGPGLGDVGVVDHDVHAECGRPLGHQSSDAAEADHPQRLAVQLDAGELAAGPLAFPQRCIGRRDLPGHAEQQSHRVLGRRQDVRLRGVDHQDAPAGGSLDIDVVQPDAGPADDLQAPALIDRFLVDLRRRADDDGVVLPDHVQELLPVQIGEDVDLQLTAHVFDPLFSEGLGDKDLQRHATGRLP
jgi:hypothetical protein